jgi:hypothetical protein
LPFGILDDVTAVQTSVSDPKIEQTWHICSSKQLFFFFFFFSFSPFIALYQEIVKALDHQNVPKKQINAVLYDLERQNEAQKSNTFPPVWKLSAQQERIEVEEPHLSSRFERHVFIDADNSPCLKKVEKYAKNDTFITAYVSPMYR